MNVGNYIHVIFYKEKQYTTSKIRHPFSQKIFCPSVTKLNQCYRIFNKCKSGHIKWEC